MDRLTHKRVNGIKTGYWSAAKKEELIDRLAAYENTGLEPTEVEIAAMKTARADARPIETEGALQNPTAGNGYCFEAGDDIWVVERDECGNASGVFGYMFLAQIPGAIISTEFINDLETLEDTVDYHIEETADNEGTDLYVFPVGDCYPNRQVAYAVLNEQKGGE